MNLALPVRQPGRQSARLLACALAVCLLLAGCGDGLVGRGSAVTDDPYSEVALAYGLPPLPHPEVTFQPDVVIVEGGGRAVRSVSDDGLTWRIDGAAPGADQLEPGKVMFVTGRGVGRVLGVFPEDGDLLVIIGPVDLTEVIRDGTFEIPDIPLDDPVTYLAGEPIWADPDALAETDDGGGGGEFRTTMVEGDGSLSLAAMQRPDRPAQPAPRRGSGGADLKAGSHSVFATCCTDGVGARVSYNKGGTKFHGTVTLTFQQPRANFYLSIAAGKVTRAEITVDGGFGIKVDFEAGIDGQNRNVRAVFPIAAEFSFPIAQVLGVPITFTISQTVAVTTAFGTSLGTMKGSGEFSVASTLGYGYANGTFGPRVSKNFQRRASLVDSLSGVPVGVMALIVEHRVKFTVGFSSFILKAGVYIELRTKYGMTMGSALGAVGTLGSHFVECRGVGLGVHAVFGVGYTILESVTRVVNRFLGLFRLGPISTSGGIESRPLEIYANQEVNPPVPLCQDPLPR